MKANTLPFFCAASLAAMSAAGISHWWSVRQIVAAVDAGLPLPEPPAPAAAPDSDAGTETAPLLASANRTPAPPSAATPSAKQEFYEALLTRMERLQTQNRDLLDQLAETNRDLMKLEFRVDTHSESFRPLPVSEDSPFTTLNNGTYDGPGVLPPRAEPVDLPSFE